MSGPLSTAHPTNEAWVGANADDVIAKARDENFPVAMRLLPSRRREQLLAIYAYARLVDDVGDELEGDRLAALDWLESELTLALAGKATHPVFVRLQQSIESANLQEAPFRDLIEANRRDQTVTSYATFDDLVGYCALSANPIGRLVLQVFDAETPERAALSDDVCTALQVIEHLQDVREDAERGRVYLPGEVLHAAGCAVDELTAASASPSLRRVIAVESARARVLLGSANPLLRSLSGPSRLAIVGFAAGGLAALDAIAAVDCDVLGQRCRPTRRRLLLHALRLRTSRRSGSNP